MPDSFAAAPPKVFISYSHDSDEHKNRVFALANRLRLDGVDATIDQYEVSPPEGWPVWMERQVRESDFVLVVCTETYLKRAERREDTGKGHGVIWESVLTYQQIYDAGARNEKFIPVLLEGGERSHIPAPLKSATSYECATEDGYWVLYARLTDQHGKGKPELGKLSPLPAREIKQPISNVKLKDAEQGIIMRVVSRFLSEGKPTPRRELIIEFQEIDLLDSLVQRSLLREINREKFLPSLMSFYFCGDQATLHLAREALETMLYTLKSLFLESAEGTQFSAREVEEKARNIGRIVGPKTIWLGLYLAEEFGVLGGYQRNDERSEIVSLRVSEQIMRFKNLDNQWDTVVQQRLTWLKRAEVYHRPSSIQADSDISDIFDKGSKTSEIVDSAVMVFISHSSKDEEIAVALIELLRVALRLTDAEIRCTSVDGHRLPVGANTDQVLKLEVREAKAFIGLITPNSMNSAYVLFELGARWGAELHMIPVLAGIGPEALAGPLKSINSISATNDAQVHQLIDDLGKALQRPAQSPASYTRYINKLIQEIQRRNSHSTTLSMPDARPEPILERGGSRKIDTLTRELVIAVARDFIWLKQLPKWTVMVGGRELPVRPLVLKAVGALPNDSTTSNAATAKLKALGFEIRYQGRQA